MAMVQRYLWGEVAPLSTLQSTPVPPAGPLQVRPPHQILKVTSEAKARRGGKHRFEDALGFSL